MKDYIVALVKLILVLGMHYSFVNAQTNVCEKVNWSPGLLSKLEKKFNTKEDFCPKLNIRFEFKINYPKLGLNFKDFNSKIENLITIWKSVDCEGHDIFLNQNKFEVWFNISEVYARKFRRELYLNKGVLNKRFVLALNKKISLQRDIQLSRYLKDTNIDPESKKLSEWKEKINEELDELSDFAYPVH